ncbi:thermonuclease family protein [Bradyrhizobium tropiciagri]|uniref:thermonuclease family protein n=1 Tax=Bradyrhizobium tropiciagri TaxID=312253 RepID=UPI001009AB0E|nr:thermonuclease family protein [Bradyrhizobium tropiciagri]
MKYRVMMAALLAIIASPVCAAKLSGAPQILDANTIEIAQTRIRLSGIEAPDTDQICLDAHGQKWACGVAARDALINYSNGRIWDCQTAGVDKYGRSLGSCFIEGQDVNAWMVSSGWALSSAPSTHVYLINEVVASNAFAGLWSGAFITPWDWRRRNKSTIIVGASSVPNEAQELLLGSALLSDPPSPDCVIKGTIDGNGERTYHSPGQISYGQIDMTKKPAERWFCSENEAEAMGWHRAAR